jgi:two-component system, OmpR family, response regulator ResD
MIGTKMTAQRIFVVDDEPQVLEVLKLYLRREGFRVDTATDGVAALAAIQTHLPDLVVLDLMLPKIDGLEVFRRLRAQCAVPVIMLTAKGDEVDRILGLELGADDYIVKPFSPREVVARVKNVLRRASPASPESDKALTYGRLRIDPQSRAVEVSNRKIDLTNKEFDLFYFLAKHPGQVFTRAQLLDQVWGYEFYGDASTVTVHLRRLREKIETNPAEPCYLATVWGIGYKFEKEA